MNDDFSKHAMVGAMAMAFGGEEIRQQIGADSFRRNTTPADIAKMEAAAQKRLKRRQKNLTNVK